jgi:hypothetical protein
MEELLMRSPETRQAHSLKVIGSNPIPATSRQALEKIVLNVVRGSLAAGGKSQPKTGGVPPRRNPLRKDRSKLPRRR